ncbi:putative molybdopterin biosynthesis protein [Sporobacter termitidis DSM 10068]|uniref:Putative molybdopterin biosynthesis protein n=1 Tax=Sporobacter termitidis DSM 10068 TaxID=1123282 RepID=A0A1M5TY87_9FIRM|nr:helix-turn-helix transcriptional regulator [Sporobacter termitidis]SHH55353.1 putative molybdopterin biosynthesis protein [Sporobacter termitidis DSM 10068]
MESDLLNVQEVADILKIARNTVYELIKRGDLDCSKVGKQMRVSRLEVDAYLKRSMGRHRQDAAPPADSPAKADGHAVLQQSEELLRGNELIICGQDISLDILVSYLNTKYEGIPIYRSHFGSYNGIYALYQGKVNVATAHLWDGDEDAYNVTYVKKMMPGIPAVVVRIGGRRAGFYVPEGNPLGFRDWADLRRRDITIANREKGSGARVLLDEKLRLMGFSGEAIRGYANEFKTHLAVAAQVSAGLADVAVGSEKGCQGVAGVSFVPLQTECYDLIIRKSDMDKPQFAAILEIMTSDDYKRDIEKAAGFDITQTGKIVGR